MNSVEKEIEVAEGVYTGLDLPTLTNADKIRVLAIDPADQWYPYRADVIGKEFELGYHSTDITVLKVIGIVEFSSIMSSNGGLCGLNTTLKGNLFEKIENEEEEMPVKKVRISPVTGKPVRSYKTTSCIPKKEATVEVKREDVMKASAGFVTLGGYFKVHSGVYKILKKNIEKGRSTLLLGPTGVGKTEMFANIAKEMGLPFTIFDMGTMSDPIMSLVGNHIIKVQDGKTTSEFKKSRFSEVIQKPGIILLDELSRANATANNLLFPCLDFRRELAMEYCFENTESIKIHPECVFVATANLGSQYTGTHKLDRALLDRFMLVEIDPLTTDQIKEAIKYHRPKLSVAEVSKMVAVYNQINKAHDDYTISFNMSLRHLKMIAELVDEKFTIYDAFYITCKGIGSKEGLKSIESILNSAK